MNIFIVGGGTVGSITAEYFSKEGHDVTVIEPDPARIRLLHDSLDIGVVEASGTDFAVMKDLPLDRADLFIALTDDDECNILSCSLAKAQGARRRIARINDKQFLEQENMLFLKNSGIDEVVNTNERLTQLIATLVRYPGMTDIQHFLDRRFVIAKYSFGKDSPHYGNELRSIEFPFPVQKIGLEQVSGFKPYDESTVVNEFLYAYYGCDIEHLDALQAIVAPRARGIRRVAIFGQGYKSGTAGAELGVALKKQGIGGIELIEEQDEDAVRLTSKYPFPVIVDDPSRPHFAKAGNLRNVDLFLGYSANFEKNIYACSVAAREGVPYTVALVRYPEHTAFVSTIPLTAFLNPAIVTANKILEHHQQTAILTRSILEYKQVECVEILISPGSPLAKSGKLPFKDSRCVAVLRGGQMLPPEDAGVVRPGDRALLLMINGEMESLRSLL